MDSGVTVHLSPDWVNTGIGLLTFIGSGIAAVAAVVWKLARHEEAFEKKLSAIAEGLKTDYTERIESAIRRGDEKRARIYERFDEHKAFCDNMFVRRDMCGVVHKNTADEVASINKRLDGFSEKIDELKDLILGKKTVS